MTIHPIPARRKLGLLLAIFGALTLAVPSARADSITKSFDIGVGTAHPRSGFRPFDVPCRLDVSVEVKYSRLGPAGALNDIPLVIELRQPRAYGANASEDGPIAQDIKVTATKTQQKVNLNGSKSTRGCGKPWRVRVTHPPKQPAPYTVTGDITLRFDDSEILNIGGVQSLEKGRSKTILLGPESGLGEGTVEITANWQHSLFGAVGPLPVRLKFELLGLSGAVVETVIGFSSNDINPTATPKFKLTYLTSIAFSCQIGQQWKLRITNETNDEVMNIFPKVKFTTYSCE